ncbi:MAG: cytidylate kinase-like family protein [Pseudobutyrivibrio sp.]|nr:cytidylate kinase-like family protein [Pseudobutyrivibrio sp.]
MAQIIIAVGREFGSGGHEIASRLADRLDIPMYDRNMLDHMAEKNGLDAERLNQYDEGKRFPLKRTVRGHSSSVVDNFAQIQFDFLKEKAESGESFVIVGRCGEYVLRKYPGLVSVFIRGEESKKIERVKTLYKLSAEEAKQKMVRHDKKRKAYHNTYSDIKWGDSRGYDLLVNSSKLGVDATTDYVEDFVRKYIEELEQK